MYSYGVAGAPLRNEYRNQVSTLTKQHYCIEIYFEEYYCFHIFVYVQSTYNHVSESLLQEKLFQLLLRRNIYVINMNDISFFSFYTSGIVTKG